MHLQYVHDNLGKPAGVFIPIKEWDSLKKQHKELRILEEEPTKEQLIQEFKEALVEIKLIEQGKLKGRPIKELLDEL